MRSGSLRAEMERLLRDWNNSMNVERAVVDEGDIDEIISGITGIPGFQNSPEPNLINFWR